MICKTTQSKHLLNIFSQKFIRKRIANSAGVFLAIWLSMAFSVIGWTHILTVTADKQPYTSALKRNSTDYKPDCRQVSSAPSDFFYKLKLFIFY